MKFAEGGQFTGPVILGDDYVESIIPAGQLGELMKALALDALLLELEGEDIILDLT